MLELRPNCEWCGKDLPPDALDARICSYECTYCSECAEIVLENVCATCGGDLVRRPIRPKVAYRCAPQTGLGVHPASTERRHTRFTRAEVDDIRRRLRNTHPARR